MYGKITNEIVMVTELFFFMYNNIQFTNNSI